MKRILLLLCLSAIADVQLQATNYYLSNNGKDSNSGKSISKPWQNISKLNGLMLKPGDSVLFKRGDTFRGEFAIRNSGTKSKPIVISAYGKGDIPVISGAELLTNGVKAGKEMLTFTCTNNASYLFANGEMKTAARYPNHGYLTMGRGIRSDGFETNKVLPDSLFTGATIRMRTIDWTFENRIIQECLDGKVKFSIPAIARLRAGYGYYLENKVSFLDTIGEWVQSHGKILLKVDGSISEPLEIEVSVRKTAISIEPMATNLVINGLQIEKFYENGIFLKKGASNITLKDNVIKQIGVTGVKIDTLVNNVLVENNNLSDIFGRGIHGIRVYNCLITKNIVKRIGMLPGHGICGVNGMIAIVLENDEGNHKISNSHDNVISYNRIDQNGYAGIRMDGSKSICEGNIVTNNSLLLNDAGGIYCWGKVKGRTFSNIIRDNLVSVSKGNNEATPNNPFIANGIYVDNQCTDITVENNTVIGSTSTGILINDISPKNHILGNTVYGCKSGIGFSEWANKDSLYGCNTERNLVICNASDQHCIDLTTWLGPDLKASTFKENTYVNSPNGLDIMKRTIPEKGIRRCDEFSLGGWQKVLGFDMGSKSVRLNKLQFLYNDTFEPREVVLGSGNYFDIQGNKMENKVIIPAGKSILVSEK